MQAHHPFQRWPDWLLGTGLAALGEVEVWLSGQSGQLPAAVAVVVTCGALVWRRRAPLATALAVSGGLAATSLVAPDIDVLAELVALVAAVYTLGAQRTARRAVLGGMAVLAVIWCSVALSPENSWGSFAFTATAVGVPLMAGRALQDRDLAARALQRQSEELARERDVRAQEAVAAERGRIARELHDIVAHSVSIMGVQASAGRRILDHDPERARQAFGVIEQASRQALAELQRMLGLLRTDGDAAATAPTPTLEELPLLVETMRRSGLQVALRFDGAVVPLGVGIELTAYRIVQESLTNVLKHAPRAGVEIRVAYTDRELEIAVQDEGDPSTSPRADQREPGYGLLGIRERVSVYGGELHARPLPSGGFVVQARLPLGEAPK
jgi:signal transduction histidine kinase